jgi:hypothetical protein
MKILLALVLLLIGFVVGVGFQRSTDNQKPKPTPEKAATIAEPTPTPDCSATFPDKFQRLDERLAWFYGCTHREPPTLAAVQAAIMALPPEKRTPLKGRDSVTQEALIGVAEGDLPITVFPR